MYNVRITLCIGFHKHSRPIPQNTLLYFIHEVVERRKKKKKHLYYQKTNIILV